MSAPRVLASPIVWFTIVGMSAVLGLGFFA
jgi:hypothetical protein